VGGGGCVIIEHAVNTGREMDFGTGFETKFGDATKWDFENRPPRNKKVLATNNNKTKPLRQSHAADSRTQPGTPHFAKCTQKVLQRQQHVQLLSDPKTSKTKYTCYTCRNQIFNWWPG
jgi:hypothetical protein